MDFEYPYVLFLYIPFLVLIVVYWILKLNRREYSIPISSSTLNKGSRGVRSILYPYLPLLRFLQIGLIIFALARPGNAIDYSEVSSFGVDIMLVQDISLSMLGTDFKPKNRLYVSKELIKKFIKRRKTDRIGMVVFAGEAYIQAPLTTDYSILRELIDEIEFDSISEQGTAIGNAIALAVARMSDSETKSKIILLITDGSSNQGIVEPETAAQLAKAKGIKIYTIGIGTRGKFSIVVPRGEYAGRHTLSGQYDEQSLQKISEISGGTFFRATSEKKFIEYIDQIDRLEKSEFTVKQYHEFDGKWMKFLVAAALFFVFEQLLRILVFRKVP